MKFDHFGRTRLWAARPVRFRLGQEDAPEVITSEMIARGLPNRLSEIPVWIILARRRLYVRMSRADGKVPTDPSFMKDALWLASNKQSYLFRDWTEYDYETLASIANDPTEEELQDLALIDGYFKGTKYASDLDSYSVPQSMFAPATTGSFTAIICHPSTSMAQNFESSDWAQKVASNPFFCGEPQNIQIPRTMSLVWQQSWLTSSGIYNDYFNINPKLTWGEIKPIMLRAIAVLEAIKDYPFPPPIDIRPQYWYVSTQADMNTFIRQDIIITKDLARIWITMAIINNYEPVSAWIVHDLERDARREKRMQVIKMIGMAAAFAIITAGLGYALAPAIAPLVSAGVPITSGSVASGIMSGVQQVLSSEQKKQLADDMDKVGQLFAADAPAFAAEAYKVRDTFGYLGEAMSDLTDEQKAALEEGKKATEYSSKEIGEQYDVEPSSWPLQKKLMIGGGIAVGAGVLGVILISILKG